MFLGCCACRTVAAKARLSWVCGMQRIWGSSPGNLVCLVKSSPSAWGQTQLAITGNEDMVCPSTLSVPTSGEETYLPDKLFLFSTWQFIYGLLMPAVIGQTRFCFRPPQIMKYCTGIKGPGKQGVQLHADSLQNKAGVVCWALGGTEVPRGWWGCVCAAPCKAHREYLCMGIFSMWKSRAVFKVQCK